MTAGFAETGPAGPGDVPGPATEPVRPAPQPPRLDRPAPTPTPTPTSSWPASGYGTGSFPPVPPAAPARRRSPLLAILVAVLALVVVAQAAFLVVVAGQLRAANRKVDALSTRDDKRLGDMDGRVRALEQQAAKNLDASAVAQVVLPSVFKITVPEGTATAFAIGTTTDGTDLLTNYHVVEGLWTQGQRTATIDHDNQRFPVQVVRVDPENDLALLHSTEKFPRLAAATGQVVPGMPIVVIGAPRGFEQSVSSGVVSALRTDIPESAGKTFIQFDAASNPGNSGSPVVNAQKQVIGVVRGNLNGPGLNYAIPISVACRSFDGIC